MNDQIIKSLDVQFLEILKSYNKPNDSIIEDKNHYTQQLKNSEKENSLKLRNSKDSQVFSIKMMMLKKQLELSKMDTMKKQIIVNQLDWIPISNKSNESENQKKDLNTLNDFNKRNILSQSNFENYTNDLIRAQVRKNLKITEFEPISDKNYSDKQILSIISNSNDYGNMSATENSMLVLNRNLKS